MKNHNNGCFTHAKTSKKVPIASIYTVKQSKSTYKKLPTASSFVAFHTLRCCFLLCQNQPPYPSKYVNNYVTSFYAKEDFLAIFSYDRT